MGFEILNNQVKHLCFSPHVFSSLEAFWSLVTFVMTKNILLLTNLQSIGLQEMIPKFETIRDMYSSNASMKGLLSAYT